MEQLLQKAGSQAVTFAIRSGISIASGYAFKTLSKFVDNIPQEDTADLDRIRLRLETSVKVIIPAIDLIELISSRGHTSLEYTLQLTRALRRDIDQFQLRVESEYAEISASRSVEVRKLAVAKVREYLRTLLERVEEAIPLITLALTTSGANLTASLPDYVSPGRFLQAANLLTAGDALFNGKTSSKIGPEFCVIFYDIFYASNRAQSGLANNDITWKEEFAKCKAQLIRDVGDELYSYHIELVEDFDDGRYHDTQDEPRIIKIDLKTITRLFFTASGRLLEIPESQSPVLVLKLNKLFGESNKAKINQKVTSEKEYLENDVEWIAFEAFPEALSDESSSGDDDDDSDASDSDSGDDLAAKLSSLQISRPAPPNSLSVLEYLLRLAALQANDQKSMYDVHDERLTLYLRDESHARKASWEESQDASAGETPRSTRKSRRESPFSPAQDEIKSQRADTPPAVTLWEKDRLAATPSLKPEVSKSGIAVSPFRDSPVKRGKSKRREKKTSYE